MTDIPQKLTVDPTSVRNGEHLLPVYPRYSVSFETGAGVFLYDDRGRAYLDLVSGLGVNALGHAHPRITAVYREQAARLVHLSNHYGNRYTEELAQRLCELTDMAGIFFSTGGTEAVEGAMKLARVVARDGFGSRKHAFVALRGGYHGRTFGSLSVTGQARYRDGFEPALPNVRFVERNDVAELRAAMDDEVCAILIEPIQGEGGVWECTPEYLAEARRLANAHHALLLYDEIQCGLGRTGNWFAYENSGVRPDVLIIGKPLGAGLPLSAFLVTQDLFHALRLGHHGSTLGGSPLACRLGLEFLSILEEEAMLPHIRQTGIYLRQQLLSLSEELPAAAEVRGRGLLQGLALNRPGRPVAEAALDRGLLLNVTQGNVLRFLPSYLLQPAHVDQAIATLRELLAVPADGEKASARGQESVHTAPTYVRQD
ncbi:MAG TPA: acetylornithine transaminase [Acidobacteriaceae bacterium]|jgi:acetylornithine/succinyldiaminopimelate/putrescine aminotransferase|nr:acetylornithine transaminase [Acidobacteriaceae bacterium]